MMNKIEEAVIYATIMHQGKVRKLHLDSDIQQIPKLSSFLATVAEEKKLSQSVATSINIAIEEAVTNVIMYSGADSVDIETESNDNEIIYTVKDSGKPFDPTQTPDVDTNQSLDDRKIGGLGIHLFKKIMDIVTYKRLGDKNILTMIKKIG